MLAILLVGLILYIDIYNRGTDSRWDEIQLYSKGSTFFYGEQQFQKLEDSHRSWWVCLNSTYTDPKDDYKVKPESSKPMYKDGKLDWYGWQIDDLQVLKRYQFPTNLKTYQS